MKWVSLSPGTFSLTQVSTRGSSAFAINCRLEERAAISSLATANVYEGRSPVAHVFQKRSALSEEYLSTRSADVNGGSG